MRACALTLAITALLAGPVARSVAGTLSYPGDPPLLLLDHPDNWIVQRPEPGDAAWTLQSPGKDAALSLRTLPGGSEAMGQAVADAIATLPQRYPRSQFEVLEEVEQHGLRGYVIAGTAQLDGETVQFVQAWYVLDPGQMAEFGYLGKHSDAAATAAVRAMLASVRKP